MFSLPGIDIFTDLCDVYRDSETKEGGITKHDRVLVVSDVPCRVYSTPNADIQMQEQAATTSASNTMCCDVGVDVRAGDEIIVRRAARIRAVPVSTMRYFAGEPNDLVEPFFGVSVDLTHKQVALYNEERVK